jgi:hypothetical protein
MSVTFTTLPVAPAPNDRDCCTKLLYGQQKGHPHQWEVAFELRGRYWDRTSDLFGVNEALSR